MKHLSIYSLILASFVLVAGCAKAPVETVEMANVSLDGATKSEANLYLPELYQAAADSFAAAEAEIAIQDARNSIVRDYDRAEALLAFVIQTADSASVGAATAKEAMAVANESLFQEAQAAVNQALAMMADAPRGKDGVMALASIRQDLELTTASVEQARAAQAEGRVFEARDMATSALTRANEIIAELDSAIQAVSPGRRS